MHQQHHMRSQITHNLKMLTPDDQTVDWVYHQGHVIIE